MPPQGTDTTPAYTTSCVNNGPSAYGLYNSGQAPPVKVVLDTVNHWLFASDAGNNRILAFPLNSSTNLLSSKTPSYVFGPSTFTDCTRYHNVYPLGLAVDPTNHLLYEANLQGGPCGANVYSTSPMASGAAPLYVLGWNGTTNCGTTAIETNDPVGLALDTTNQLLYMSDPGNNRVLVFPAYGNASWGGTGESALYEIGQPSGSTAFTSSSSGTTQSTLNNPKGLAYDATNQRLYVADNSNNRVMVFPAYGNASWTGNGENALYELGQTSFTSTGSCNQGNNSPSAASLCNPEDVVADPADNLVYVSDTSNNRILAFPTSSLSNGENASFVLGAANFLNGHDGSINDGIYSSQSQMDAPSGLAFDSTNKLLYENDATDDRIMIFNTSSMTTGLWSTATQAGQDACGISSSGALYCWGNGGYALGLGNNTGNGFTSPIEVGSAANWTAISQGSPNFDLDACGIAGGALYCWGYNTYGAVGQGNTTGYYFPQQVGSATNWSVISTSGADTCGIAGGALYCWGENLYGEVGNGAPNSNTVFVASVSGTVPTTGGFGSVAAANTICQNASTASGSIAPAGTYKAWTAVTTGTDDPNTTFTKSTIPYEEVNGTFIAGNWTSLISGTLTNGITLDETGTARSGVAWTNVSATTAHASTSGNSTTKNCASWTNATGSDSANTGTLGSTSSTWSKSSATSTCSTSAYLLCFSQSSATNQVTTPTRIGTDTTWTTVSTGGTDTCGIDNGKLYCWGRNNTYQDGQGNTTEYTTPTQVGSGTNWIAVSVATADTCGIRGSGGSGALYCWGNNGNGNDGVGNTNQVTTPTQVGTATNWTAISLGGGGNAATCGIAGGALYCWGNNSYGQLGLGNTTSYTTPQQVGSATNWTTVSAGAGDNCAIAGSQLYCWGQNTYGDDGQGNYTSPLETPQLVSIFDLNVENATDEIGQYASQTSTATVNWTQNSPQNGANGLGLWNPAGITMDPVNHHLFVADGENNRILVYTLNADNSIPTSSGGHTASYVLGASGFPSNLSGFPCTASTFSDGPEGLDFDVANSRLFVSDGSRVLIFDNMSTISNNMAASYVLGQSSLTNCSNGGATQSTFSNVYGVAYDSVNQRLFITDDSSNRVLAFNVAPSYLSGGTGGSCSSGSYGNGENACYVLGQTSFTGTGNGTTSTTLRFDGEYLAFDAVNQRLFVADTGNNRVMVFNVAPTVIANGEAASYELGQANFTSNCCQYSGFTQATVNFPGGLAYDATGSRLFAYRGGASSLVVFNVGPGVITSDENASFVLGSSNFTSAPGGVTQSRFNSGNIGTYLYYDPGSQRLFLSDNNNNRVIIFDVSFPNQNFMQMLPD